jgi:hypothetical protein
MRVILAVSIARPEYHYPMLMTALDAYAEPTRRPHRR